MERDGLVVTEIISNFRFARLTEKGLASIPDAVDLIKFLACTKLAFKEVVEDFVKKQHLMDVLPNYRASREWWDVARRLLIKAPSEYTNFDREYLELSFDTWKEEIRNKVLIFVDVEEEIVILPYETRFTSKRYAKRLIKKFDKAWLKATKMFDVGVFITITLPSVFPLIVQKYILAYLMHRLKSYLRKKYGDNILFADDIGENVEILKTPPHISVYEPQNCLSYHLHAIIFGITRIMDKKEFTLWLDKHLINFLSKMGHHIQKTVNNRLTEEQVRWFNKFGRKLLKKYLRYKRKHRKYEGPINWITQVRRKKINKDGNDIYYWEFAHPPPDYVKFLEERQKQAKLATDGAGYSPNDYIKKYLVKNLREITEEDSSDSDGSNKIGEKDKKRRRKHKLAWYWLVRARFFTVSPVFREQESYRGRVESGWGFVGVFEKDDIEYLKWLEGKLQNTIRALTK